MKKAPKIILVVVLVIIIIIGFLAISGNLIPIINSILDWFQSLIGFSASKRWQLPDTVTNDSTAGGILGA